ncbi:L-lysine 2-3-aminomutase, partial [Penicillium paradoxum]|uniref:L-lysine 2-3-aminomutase n=1 Tax=Penicillium paradoxum TaxID=176176 RepID=UPI0025494D29
FSLLLKPNTYDHRVWKTGLPVRSAVLKPHAGELVVGWVTTSESSLLVWKTGLPVRSAVLKPHAGELVVGWVTTSESSLLYVFRVFFSCFLFALDLAGLLFGWVVEDKLLICLTRGIFVVEQQGAHAIPSTQLQSNLQSSY